MTDEQRFESKGKGLIRDLPVTRDEGYTLQSRTNLPSNCEQCGTYKTCKSYKIPGRWDPRKETKDKPVVMLVGQSPGRNEDFQGQVFIGPSGEFLGEFLGTNKAMLAKGIQHGIEVRWYLTNAKKCYQGQNEDRSDKKVSAKEIELCNVFLREEILEVQPKVIVCFGEVALRSIMGKSAPRTIAEASRNVYDFEGIKVFTTYHPVNDKSVRGDRPGARDLHEPYMRLFKRVEQECFGTYKEHQVKYEVITNPRYFPVMPPQRTVDIEDTHWDKDPYRKTIFHLGSELLCWSLCWRRKDGEYETRVYIDEGCSKENMEHILRDAEPNGHNLKYDFLGVEVFLGIDVYELIKDFFDTFSFWFLQDQSLFGNGLKELAQKLLGAPDWSTKIWNYIKEVIQRKKVINQEIRKENKRRIAENPDAELLEEILEVANMGDLPREMLIEYSANDAYWNARLFHEVVPTMRKIPEVLWEMTKRATRSLQRLEKHGLPMDTARLKGVAALAISKRTEIYRLLHKLPEVQAVLNGWHKIHPPDLYNDEERIELFAPQDFNDKGKKFLESLAYRMNYHTWEYSEKSKQLVFNAMVWRVIVGKEGERTREQWIWYYIWQYRQLNHLVNVFIKNMVEYTVENRVHTTYKLGKSSSESEGIGGDVGGGIESGRIGSSNPNLLNLKKDKLFRSCVRCVD